MTTMDERAAAWETESGLVDDVDGIMVNCHFGKKDTYMGKLMQTEDDTVGEMFLYSLKDPESGELLVEDQGMSIGKGWAIAEDGLSISSGKHKNVIHQTIYGIFQNKVIKDLKVPMYEYDLPPTDARVWNGMAFHWNLEDHDTVGGKKARGLMPTTFIKKYEEDEIPAGDGEDAAPAPVAAAPAPAPARTTPRAAPARATRARPGIPAALEQSLATLVGSSKNAADFRMKALKIEGATEDAVMTQILDDSPNGFWATHGGK